MAITVSYFWPVATPGSATAPTATTPPPQIPTSTVKYNRVNAELIGDGTSTSVTVVHNLGMTVQELAALWPTVGFEATVSGAPSVWVSARATNSVTLGLSGTFSGTFGIVRISRPVSSER